MLLTRRRRLFVLSAVIVLLGAFGSCLSAAAGDNEAVVVCTNLLERHGIMSFRPIDFLVKPSMLMKVWIDKPMPLRFYTEEEKRLQREANTKANDWIWTQAESAKAEYVDNYSVPVSKRRIDYEEITPYTWKWLTLKLDKDDGTTAELKLRRPHWWIRHHKLTKVGNEAWLVVSETGLSGFASVTHIRPSILDTRLWEEKRQGKNILRPITGWIKQSSSDVWSFLFKGSKEPVKATKSHPFWSETRRMWLDAEKLKAGERVRTKGGKLLSFLAKRKLPGRRAVYNLEIYRDHNFFVGDSGILVHNACSVDGAAPNDWKKKIVGKAHGTTPGHKFRTYRKAIEMAKSGKYEKVYVNRGLSAEVPGVSPNRRPDVWGIRTGSRQIDQFEVPSRWDTRIKLMNRMSDNAVRMGGRAGGMGIEEIR